MDCGSKSGEWGTRRRNCRRGREWCFPDGGPRGSAGRRTRELTASTSPTVGRWEEGKRGYWVDEAALAAGAAARGPGAVGSLGGGEGDAWQAGRWAPVKGLVVEQRQQLQEQPPQQPPRPLPQVPRENGCGAGRAAKFASARRGADWLGKPAPNSAVRPPGWSPWQDPRGWWLVPLWAVQKVEAGAGRRRWLPLCSSPPLPHPVRATSPPPLRPPPPPSSLSLAGLPSLARLQAEGHGPCPIGWRSASPSWHGAERRKESNGAVTLRCRHRGPGAGRGGRAAEAGRGPKSGYPGGGREKAGRPCLRGARRSPNGALPFSGATRPGALSWAFRVKVASEAGARWAAGELRGGTRCPLAPVRFSPLSRLLRPGCPRRGSYPFPGKGSAPPRWRLFTFFTGVAPLRWLILCLSFSSPWL